jgi:hypothetical protein
MKKNNVLSFTLVDGMKLKLKKLSETEMISQSAICRKALHEFLLKNEEKPHTQN